MKMKMKKPNKDKIVELLNPFSPITQNKYIPAFRSLNEKYPEIIEYLPFIDLILIAKTIEELAERILTSKSKRDRIDSEAGYKKRKSRKCGGRQRGDLWTALQKINDIRVFNKDEWGPLGINDEKTWKNLFSKLRKARIEDIEYESLEKYTGYSYKALHKMIDEQDVLREVFDLFMTEVNTALRSNNPDSKTFLNTVKTVWEEDLDVVLNSEDFKNSTKRGNKISHANIIKRNDKILKILLSGNFNNFKGGKDYLALRTTLCIVARYAYYRLLFPLITERWGLEEELQRKEAIIKILHTMKKFSISPQELSSHSDSQILEGKAHKHPKLKGIAD
jgi:hypothetical protein